MFFKTMKLLIYIKDYLSRIAWCFHFDRAQEQETNEQK